MTRTATLLVGLFILQLFAPADAQENPETVAKWYLHTVKPGHDLQWEEAFKDHVDWHRQQNDTWTWHTYVIVTGDRLGKYITMTTDHAWSDFDSPAVSDQDAAADAIARVGPHVESVSSRFWNELPELSRGAGALPSPLIQIINYGIKPSKQSVFVRNVLENGQMVDEHNLSVSYFWFVQPDGGAGSRTYTRIVPYENWGALRPRPGATGGFAAFAETFGEAGFEQWMARFGESVEWLTSEYWRYRPDLSYVP